jgi:hypothetical protein
LVKKHISDEDLGGRIWVLERGKMCCDLSHLSLSSLIMIVLAARMFFNLAVAALLLKLQLITTILFRCAACQGRREIVVE